MLDRNVRGLTRPFPRPFLVAASRSPQVPSRSFSFPPDKDMYRHGETELRPTADQSDAGTSPWLLWVRHDEND
jgi:hypothetical protein